MQNVLTEKQRRDSWFWLFAGGFFAISLALFLFWSDRTLTNSDKEKVLGRTLHEIRSAQASLPSGADARQLGSISTEQRMAELEKVK